MAQASSKSIVDVRAVAPRDRQIWRVAISRNAGGEAPANDRCCGSCGGA